ncbi:MAG TPA: ABC transporter ATP-binding protein [Candidatus Onthousia faecavium]|nr:ABC transporter ATP-binding protein [Candidatus Onthousia faecavium]
MDNIIKVNNLSKSYGDFKLSNLNIEIKKGSIIGLIGQNGAGKTTFIKLLLDLIKKDSGDILIFGQTINNDVKDKIGIVLDDSFFPEVIKVQDINQIMKNIYKAWDEKMFFNYLKKFSLNGNMLIKNLSTGMKKKLEIITALSHHPKLLILDEPTSGLDPIVRNEILDLFLEFIENGENSILFSSHITSDIEISADYIIFIDKGKLIFDKAKDDLLDNYGIVKCNEESFKKITKDYIVAWRKNKYNYEVLVNDRRKVKKLDQDLTIDKATLADIMLLIVKGEK